MTLCCKGTPPGHSPEIVCWVDCTRFEKDWRRHFSIHVVRLAVGSRMSFLTRFARVGCRSGRVVCPELVMGTYLCPGFDPVSFLVCRTPIAVSFPCKLMAPYCVVVSRIRPQLLL